MAGNGPCLIQLVIGTKYAAVLNMNSCKQSILRIKLSYSAALSFFVLADKKKTAQAKDSAA